MNYPQSNLISKLFSQGQPLVFSKGNVILGNESRPTGVYYISTGYVKIYTISNEGDEYVHIIYGHGEIFPIIWAYLDVTSRSTYYEAISDCVVWRISRDWYVEKVSKDLELSNALSIQLAHQFQATVSRLDNLEYKKAGERVAYRLLFLASRFGVREETSILIDAPITHELFANSINLVRESVSREMEILERQQIIKRFNHHIKILNVHALENKLSEPPDLHSWHLS
jgi:CRP-like cAMP-binding protein